MARINRPGTSGGGTDTDDTDDGSDSRDQSDSSDTSSGGSSSGVADDPREAQEQFDDRVGGGSDSTDSDSSSGGSSSGSSSGSSDTTSGSDDSGLADDPRQQQEQFDDRVGGGGSSGSDSSQTENTDGSSQLENDLRQQQEQFDDRVTRGSDPTTDRRDMQERFDSRIGDDAGDGGGDPTTRSEGVGIDVVDVQNRGSRMVTKAEVGQETVFLQGQLSESEIRSRFLDGAGGDRFDDDDFVITGVSQSDGELGANIEPTSQARRDAARAQAAEAFDAQFPDLDIESSDVVLDTESGQAQLAPELQATIARRRAAEEDDELDEEDIEVIFDGFDLAGLSRSDGAAASESREIESRGIGYSGVALADETAEEAARQNSGRAADEPGAVANTVGGAIQTVGNSPVGSAVSRVSEPVFGDLDDRQDGVVGAIDRFLEDIQGGFENRVTEPLEEADPDSFDARSVGLVRPFGITGEDVQGTTTQFAEFANPGSIGRDFVTVFDAGARGAAFLSRRGPEGAQIAGEVAQQGAAAAPGAIQSGVQDIRENPREAAQTGAALVATFGAGALASGATRAGASVASRGARAGARRADDVVDIARSRGGSIRERAPDVSIRRDPTSGPLDVDPMLQQQLRNVARRQDTDIDLSAGADESLARRIGRATREAEINAQLNANVAASRVRAAVPDRSSIPDTPSGPDGDLARRTGRATRRAELNALLNADVAASRVRAAVPDADSVPNPLDRGDSSLARQAGRRFESERRSLELSAAAAPSAVRSRTSEAAAQLEELVPSRPAGLSFTDSPASIARRAGRRFESERRSLALSAAAAPSAARSRVSNAGAEVLERAQTAAGAPRSALENLERPEIDLDIGLSDRSLSVPRPDRRVRDAVEAASEATLRVGPIRPGRTDLEIGDFDIDLDTFDEDAIDLDLDGSGGGAGSGPDTLDLDADVDAGGGAGGGDQIAAVRLSRQAGDDIDLDGSVRARERAAGGPAVSRVDPLAGIGAVEAGVFGPVGSGSNLGEFEQGSFGTGAVEEPLRGLGGLEGFGIEALSPDVGLDAPQANLNIATPTMSTATTTDRAMDTTGSLESPPAGTSPPSFRPPKAPSLDMPSGEPSDDDFAGGVNFEDQTFDTGVADAEEAFENLF